jgi:hypothetical protein
MPSTKNIYLLLTILGFIAPNYWITQIVREHNGFDIVRFFDEISLNASANLINTDLALVATAAFVFIIIEARKHQIKYWWLSIIGTFGVGICFGFPLFLYLREIKLEEKIKN